MQTYKLKGDENHFLTFFIEAAELAKMDEDFDLSFDGNSKLDWWQTPNATFYEGDDYEKKSIAMPDITVWESFLVLNEKALNILSPSLSNYGEFLPVLSEGIPYYLFHTLSVIDDAVVDTDNSKKIIENDIYMGLSKLNFHNNKINDTSLIFRTHYDDCIDVYCTEQLKQQVSEADLKGLTFETDLASY